MGNPSDELIPDAEHNFLVHGNYRFLNKADFTLMEYYSDNVRKTGAYGTYHQPADLSEFSESRLWSNGRAGVLIPEKYT